MSLNTEVRAARRENENKWVEIKHEKVNNFLREVNWLSERVLVCSLLVVLY